MTAAVMEIVMQGAEYMFGHADPEVRRLELQAGLLAPGTERILRAAGIGPGMSVLDVGTRTGDVALLAAALVGPGGAVLGIDGEASVLERARERSRATGWLRYEATTLDALPASARFDVVVSRYVLQHQADHVGFLRDSAARVRPGGTLVCMAPGLVSGENGQPWSSPRAALYDEGHDYGLSAFRSAGLSMTAGMELVRLFEAAGLPEPDLAREEIVGGPRSPLVEYLCLTIASLMPLLERHGIATAAGIGIDTLQARMQAEVDANRSQLWTVNLIGAWSIVA